MVELLTNAIDDGIATGAPGPRLHRRRQDRDGPDRRPRRGRRPRTARLVERWQYIDGWVDSSFVGLLPGGRHEARDADPHPPPGRCRGPYRWPSARRPCSPASCPRCSTTSPFRRTGRSSRSPSHDDARLDRSPQRGACASSHPHRRRARRHRRPAHRTRCAARPRSPARRSTRAASPPDPSSSRFAASAPTATRSSPTRFAPGPSAALVERAGRPARRTCATSPQVVVPDALRALQDLAAWWRSRHAGARRRHHRLDRQDDRQGDHRRRPLARAAHAPQRGQPQLRDRPADDPAPARRRRTRPPCSRWACTRSARSPGWPRSRGPRSASCWPCTRRISSGRGASSASRSAKAELPRGAAARRARRPQRRRSARRRHGAS